MPIPRYQLDDRNFNDLVQEMVARIPAHTPEWTNPREGDPGRTLIDLFAWLADMLLYRVNLIPERQRLEFLRLLNIPMRPALAARGLVVLESLKNNVVRPVTVPRYTTVKGTVSFETAEEVTIFPLIGKVFVKRRPNELEKSGFAAIQQELEGIYDIDKGDPYVTTALFQEIPVDPEGIDIAKETIDQSVWIALLAQEPSQVDPARGTFRPDEYGEKIINIGFAPRLSVPDFADEVYKSVDMREIWQWEMPSARKSGAGTPYDIPYLTLDIKDDTTGGFIRQGVVRLALPTPERIVLPANSVDDNIYAGTGNLPPRIDNEAEAKRLISWIRLRPKQTSQSLPVRWMGVNVAALDQLRTIRDVVVATSDGLADQIVQLPAASIEAEGFELEVEATGIGYQGWLNRPLFTADPYDRFFELDEEAGVIRFGDGVRGVIPEAGNRIRVRMMRYGGGKAGNLAAGNLTGIAFPHLKVVQPLEMTGGVEAETLEAAQQRIPGELKHRERAVTATDYAELALQTPGIELARAEVLPRFKPRQRLHDIVGAVSVMVLPKTPGHRPPNPRPDRNMLTRVHAFLEARRPIGVELSVIGTEYMALGLSVAVSIRDGFAKHQVIQDVQDALRQFLWPLPPGGHEAQGWPLGRTVINHELEVVVARVQGILTVNEINMFHLNDARQWELAEGQDLQRLTLDTWQLPELLTVAVAEETAAQTFLDDEYGEASGSIAADGAAGRSIPIPVVPEICR